MIQNVYFWTEHYACEFDSRLAWQIIYSHKLKLFHFKTHFWPFIYIIQRAVSHSKLFDSPDFFFYRFRTFQLFFYFFCSLRSILMSIFLELFQKNSFQVFLIDLWGFFVLLCLYYECLGRNLSCSTLNLSYFQKPFIKLDILLLKKCEVIG